MAESWSSIRKRLEQDLLCESLRGRVQYFRTNYHGAPDEYGRFAVRVDGEEWFKANPYNEMNYSRIAWQMTIRWSGCLPYSIGESESEP